MDAFVARQPILDRSNKVFGYELLFRNSINNNYCNLDGDEATIEVIKNSFINIGVDKVVGSNKAFINFTGNILKTDIFNILSPEIVIIEILETVDPTEEIVDICKKLKSRGFIIALDDFVFNTKYKKLLDLADIIKVDFRLTSGYDRKSVMDLVNRKNIKFLAEKIESMEEYNEAVSLGYSYFQGYYFSKPAIVSTKMIPENKLNNIKIIRELNKKELSLENIVMLMKKDMSLSYKFLKLINSANFSFRNKIDSLNQAVALLGETGVKRWLYYAIIKSISEDKPHIIINNSIIRARFAELLAAKLSMKDDPFNGYLMGMLSMIDLILDKPMDEILNELFIPKVIREALTGEKTNEYAKILELILAYEKGQWKTVSQISKELNLDENYIPEAYLEAINWAKDDKY